MRVSVCLLPLLCLAAPLLAEPVASDGLPDEAAVLGALEAHPGVAAARARVAAAQADSNARARGPHEFTFQGSYIRRTVDREGDFDEFDTQLTRPIRLPGKARLDRDIGGFGVDAAANRADDARHDAALLLAEHWYAWLGASAEADVDRQAVANYERDLAATRRRVELGDAALLETDQTGAALATARLMLEQSQGRARLARGRLAAQFPALPLAVEAPRIPAPEIPAGGLARLRDLVPERSHEIAAAEAQARQSETLAERARRERVADPSVGVRLFSERSGAERGAGLLFSMPLGGGYRTAQASQAAAEANAARSEAELARFEVREEAEANFAEAEFRHTAWQRAHDALKAQMAALAKLRRGQELGEIDLSDLLLGERMVHDAFRAEASARVEAVRAITLLRINSHDLWLVE